MPCYNKKCLMRGGVVLVTLLAFNATYAHDVLEKNTSWVKEPVTEVESQKKGPVVLFKAEKAFCLPSIFQFSKSVKQDELCSFTESKTDPLLFLKKQHLGPLVIKQKEPLEIETILPPQDSAVTDIKNEMPQQVAEPVKIAILIDDLGYNRKGMEASLALPNEVALAILPHTPFANKTALTAHETGRVILLHAPMESIKQNKLGPGGLYSSMNKAQVVETLNDDLLSLPNVVGVNNHMGSLLTQKNDTMEWVMQVLEEKDLFFIDSVTSAKSVGWQEAVNNNIRTMKRDVFLDNVTTEKAIDAQFDKLLKIAHKKGHALAIGHPYPATLRYLEKRLSNLDPLSVQLVSLTRLLDLVLEQESVKVSTY